MDLEFSNISELKHRMLPALNIRVKQLNRDNIKINVDDLWNYFVNIWRECHNLTLADLVDDVLNKEIVKQED